MAEQIVWKDLGFAYRDTGSHITAEYRDGSWQPLQVRTEPYLKLHIAATCLHYGQACFEGLKAFGRKDGSVASFRPADNAQRMIDSAERIVMVPPDKELFLDAVARVIEINREYVPPYGTGASLYIRPLLIGSSPHVGLHPSEDYMFIVLAMPVGPYYKNGFYPVKAYVQEEYDRAAPRGVGNVKVAGNYAAGMKGDMGGKAKGFPICLYLDSASHTFVDEFGTSNFIGITKDGKTFVTPDSSSVLPSITNRSLQQIAADFGLNVERRPISVDQLGEFGEVGACGTAAVITPIYSISHGAKTYTFGREDRAGEMLTRLFQEIQGIQFGDVEDRHDWMVSA